MALARFVVTANVTVTPEVAAAITAGVYTGGGIDTGFGGAPTGAQSAGKYGWLPVTFRKGEVVYADSVAGTDTGAKILYQAIGSSNLRAYVQGQDDVGHSGIAN